ncbi:Fe2+-dependent dioxygenase [Cellvibrio polysaccharolyticus]|uniref:Fe2+-dependent dioxygenase n=1 Tax=Cellvibrio polysaccharolyticus TaxID=2082724 RepID=A0A928V8T1_9GAMM|nr:Fe2+-dependent dioxygenase [Cellvibrio polysaccharolyticus]MBE8718144.1 Fe2+-dependent dioxygenase [Cellvibrio polysaccharolyticus]
MLDIIPEILTAEQVAQCRHLLANAAWQDGKTTAGHVARQAKQNRQLAADDPLTTQLGNLILDALVRNPRFMSAALPLKVLPPRFNRYENGGHYGNHIDGAVMNAPGSSQRIRTDLSATLFFCDPDDYDGGELVIEDTYGSQSIKLPAGHLVLYPGTSLHRVTPVTRGARIAAFFWVQSLVREDSQRSILTSLDTAIQHVSADTPDSDAVARLTGVYHNLLRQWSET